MDFKEELCCPNCFGDIKLGKWFDGVSRGVEGDCSFCGNPSSLLLPPEELRELFLGLIEGYSADCNGIYLSELLKRDWNLFSDSRMDDHKIRILLAQIAGDSEVVFRKYAPLGSENGKYLPSWSQFRQMIMHENRWFVSLPETFEDTLKYFLDQLTAVDTLFSSTWYRARRSPSGNTIPLKEMGAPPRELAGHGRANPAGIPYLYLASDATTAIAEVRPNPGETVCVASFELRGFCDRKIKLADLRDPRTLMSPFFLGDMEEIESLLSHIALLEHLGKELTRPIRPSSQSYEYVPTQFLCEFIKDYGFDGVVFNSSMGDGVNLALFDSLRYEPMHTYSVSVESVVVRTTSFS